VGKVIQINRNTNYTTQSIRSISHKVLNCYTNLAVTTYSASASRNSLNYNYEQGARSFVTPCLYMHTVSSLVTLCNTLEL